MTADQATTAEQFADYFRLLMAAQGFTLGDTDDE